MPQYSKTEIVECQKLLAEAMQLVAQIRDLGQRFENEDAKIKLDQAEEALSEAFRIEAFDIGVLFDEPAITE